RAAGAPWPSARQWLLSVPIGVLFFVAGNGFITIAMQSIDSGAAAVLAATMPLWLALLAGAAGERSGGREWLGLGLGLAGVVVLVGGASARGEPAHLVLLLLSPPAWAVGSLLARRLPLPSGLASAALQMITGGLALGLVAAARGERFTADATGHAWLALGYLAVAGSLVGFSAFNWLLRNTRPALATSYAYVNPVLAVLIGAVLGNEPLGPSTLIATSLIVGAVVMVVRGRRT
ncbi:MAG TPA: EamA family transporter, partial [Kofleriaceae bacterium]|nr:EamA family transporter [Kofleriaceae bacterium]